MEMEQAELLTFWQNLASGFCHGQQLLGCLRSIEADLSGRALGVVAGALADDVATGASLADAMRRHPGVFGQHVLCLVEGGERAGILDRVLLLIVEHAWRCPDCILAPPADGH